jgi:DnaJ-class molecular chaperone
MKVSKESFALIKAACEEFDTPEARAEYRDYGASHKRYRWDLLWFAGKKRLPERFISNLYDREDVNDDHIDTVLRRVVKPF